MMASSARVAAARRVGTVPASAWRAMSLIARAWLAEPRPAQARRMRGDHLRRCGKRPSPKSATNRPRIVCAARPLSC